MLLKIAPWQIHFYCHSTTWLPLDFTNTKTNRTYSIYKTRRGFLCLLSLRNVFSSSGHHLGQTGFHYIVICFTSPSENHIKTTENLFETARQSLVTRRDLQFRFKSAWCEKRGLNIKYPKVQTWSWMIACHVNSKFPLITYLKCHRWFTHTRVTPTLKTQTEFSISSA